MNKRTFELLKELRSIHLAPGADLDIEKAAMILLQFNRNQILYQHIRRKKDIAKLKYEAKKVFDLECARRGINPGTFEDSEEYKMNELEKKAAALSPVEEKEKTMGKRPDHDTLPEEIRYRYNQNVELFLRVRKLHETLKGMDAAAACDRFPYVKELLEVDDKISENWKVYDEYQLPEENPPFEGDPVTDIVIDAKRISSNRKYISDNKAKLASYIEAGNEKKVTELRKKVQERVDELLKSNAGISDEQLSELVKLGINV